MLYSFLLPALFGIIVQIVIYMRIRKAKNEQDDDWEGVPLWNH